MAATARYNQPQVQQAVIQAPRGDVASCSGAAFTIDGGGWPGYAPEPPAGILETEDEHAKRVGFLWSGECARGEYPYVKGVCFQNSKNWHPGRFVPVRVDAFFQRQAEVKVANRVWRGLLQAPEACLTWPAFGRLAGIQEDKTWPLVEELDKRRALTYDEHHIWIPRFPGLELLAEQARQKDVPGERNTANRTRTHVRR